MPRPSPWSRARRSSSAAPANRSPRRSRARASRRIKAEFSQRRGTGFMTLRPTLLAGLALAGALAAMPAGAQPVTFAGKELKLIVGFGAGSGYDQYARLLAGHIADHLAGKPTIVPENMPGAGSIKAENYLYN